MPPLPRAAKFDAMRAQPGVNANSTLPSAATLAQVADALAWPLLLLRADTTLLHANEAARGLLRQGQPLHISRQREVQPASLRHHAAFEQACDAALAKQPTRLLRWPAAGAADAWCGLLRALPHADGRRDAQRDTRRDTRRDARRDTQCDTQCDTQRDAQQPALLLALCPDTGADSELLALLTLRPPLVPPGLPAPPAPPARPARPIPDGE